MPSGSISGEKRGGRKAGTPNRVTSERRILADAAEKKLQMLFGTLPRDASTSDRLIDAADKAQMALVDAANGAMPLADALAHRDTDAFSGDGVDYMQSVYRNTRMPVAVRMDAAKACARYERPMLSSTTITADADSLALWRGSDARIALSERVATVLMRAGAAPVIHDVCDTSADTQA